MVIVNPSYSFPWSLRLGTFVFTVNPSLVLLLNCFQKKKKKKRVTSERTETDCLAIVLKHLKYMDQKLKRTNWGNRTTTLFPLSFISYWMAIRNIEWGTLTFSFTYSKYKAAMFMKSNCTKQSELYRFVPKLHVDSNLLVLLCKCKSRNLRACFMFTLRSSCISPSVDSRIQLTATIS